jgi:hypothetical protein
MKKLELIELFNYEMDEKLIILDKLNREAEIRKKDVEEIHTRFHSGEIRTLEEAEELAREADQHIARMEEIQEKVRLMIVEIMFDIRAIHEAKD